MARTSALCCSTRFDVPLVAGRSGGDGTVSLLQGRIGQLVVNLVGVAAVFSTLAVDLGRGEPIASLAAALAVAAWLFGLWVRARRPRGIRNVAADG
ncbi:MAG TPA: hypothetical protein VHF06_16605 [Pseudonocardiaceae bacterium]|nr:hypothetical protein [Pseudonocardiaceae bacterium]